MSLTFLTVFHTISNISSLISWRNSVYISDKDNWNCHFSLVFSTSGNSGCWISARKMTTFTIFLLLIALNFLESRFSLADTPANCTYEDIIGTWHFFEGSRGQNSQIDCDKFAIDQGKSSLWYFTQIWLSSFKIKKYQINVYSISVKHNSTIQLLFPDIASDQFGNLGKWTMVYNQGFEVTINFRKYFAFSNWLKAEHSIKSLCDETKPGWSHDIYSRDWACFLGEKLVFRPLIKKRKNIE